MNKQQQPFFLENTSDAYITCCDYHRRYFSRLKTHAAYYQKIYQHLLSTAETFHPDFKEEGCIWDFGCGLGVLGAYSAQRGWNKVGQIDMHPHCVENAQKLAKQLGYDNNITTLQGTEQELVQLRNHTGSPQVIISMDVIEHVYHIPTFLQQIKKAAPNALVLLTTGAIPKNPLRSKPIVKLQINDELRGVDSLQTTVDNPYAGMAFLEVRKQIILNSPLAKALSEAEVNLLAKATRGLNEADILLALQNFIASGEMPQALAHPTNTCDPISSSWTERMLTIEEYEEIFEQAGYALRIEAGKYNVQTGNVVKRIALSGLNSILHFIPNPNWAAYQLLIAQPLP